jgi:hypothetical protein
LGTLIKVMAKVNAPYGAGLSARQLAARLVTLESVDRCDASVFAFLSEVRPSLQTAFIDAMGVDEAAVREVARLFAIRSGYPLEIVVT